MRTAFLGSPAFALPSLEALLAAGHEVALVVSQPARPVGRHAVPEDPPVAALARSLGLELWQPESLKGEEALARLAAPRADVFVVVAYGRILGPRTLALPRLGCLNVHGSLLPRWRGASPVQAALLAGDAGTGVSLMRMDPGMDTGPVYAEARTAILPGDDAGALSERLARLGAGLLVSSLPAIAAGTLLPSPQDGARATECGKVTREDARVDWSLPAEALARRARAFTPWPGLFCERGGKRLKLAGVEGTRDAPAGGVSPAPGTVLSVGDLLVVACGSGALAIATVQAEGRKALPARDFAAGARLRAGETLG